ncbi:cupin domain-containing protein [Alcanivorax jadensis]|jgi:quercetin dioxygenase-like cupin family protein|uniref:cupin domain-containing protein n=1 Tax=Alcanivorax jadensis TaxID=64988 RepID=UPI002353F693|nr:cupin domain-containing protein [Alcanivorax jadensis]|tara:strand:- start:11863 stop:12213 length:351 start_codon:yes stop_codon:yes gene_type:complete
MSLNRIFDSYKYFEPSDGEPIRSVVASSTDAVIVAWHVKPGQSIKPHRHPAGQDTWTILSGEGDYVIDEQGNEFKIKAGDIVIAHTNQVHGLHNRSAQPIYFVSVVAPSEAGYELL